MSAVSAAPVAAIPPTIVLLEAHTPARVLREVCAGAEEEGVPVEVQRSPEPIEPAAATAPAAATQPAAATEPAAATKLAYTAAGRSRLQVGIGLDHAGGVAVHHSTLPEDIPVLTAEKGAGPADWRRAGRVAARIVKRLPLT